MKELPSGHLNLSPEIEAPNWDCLQFAAVADCVNTKLDVNRSKMVPITTLILMKPGYSVSPHNQYNFATAIQEFFPQDIC